MQFCNANRFNEILNLPLCENSECESSSWCRSVVFLGLKSDLPRYDDKKSTNGVNRLHHQVRQAYCDTKPREDGMKPSTKYMGLSSRNTTTK